MSSAPVDAIVVGPNPNFNGSSVNAGNNLWCRVTNDDYDTLGYALSVIALGTSGTKGSVSLNSAATNGLYYTAAAGSAFTYLALGQSYVDTFTYTISNGHGPTLTLTDSITVLGTWAPPTVVAGTAATTASGSVTINVLANASDSHAGATISVTALNLTETAGLAVINAAGAVTYNPGAAFKYFAAGATATDTFGYTVSDNHGVSSTTTETVTVTGTWLAPTVAAGNAATTAAQAVSINVLASASDPQAGTTLSVASLNTAATKGTVAVNAAGAITYQSFAKPCTGCLLMSSCDRAVDAGEGQLRLSGRHQLSHDLVPHATLRPPAEAKIGMMPVTQLGRDRTPLRPVVQPPDNRLDRAAIFGSRTGSTNCSRRDRCFELRPLGIRQDLHRLSDQTTSQIRLLVTDSSHEMRTDPTIYRVAEAG